MARFFALHGQAYDTVSLSAGAAAEQAQKPLRLTLAARISQPLLTEWLTVAGRKAVMTTTV